MAGESEVERGEIDRAEINRKHLEGTCCAIKSYVVK